jgi:hypothetical protein
MGAVEAGSSGSPLFNQERRIIGQLGTGVSCVPNDFDLFPPIPSGTYGRFNWSWDGGNGSTSRTRLRDWLDPLGINPQYLDGIGCRVGVTDRTITTNEVIPSTCDIRIGDVQIKNNSTLTLDAPGGTIITAPVICRRGFGNNIEVV